MPSNLFGVPQPGAAPALDYARVPITVQANLNVAIWGDVTLNALSLDTNIAGAAIAANEIQNVPQGFYLMSGIIRFQSFVQNAGLSGTFRVNGGVQTVHAQGNANVSAQGGWIAASIDITAIIECPVAGNNNNVGMSARLAGAAGALSTLNGSLSILRIA